MSNSNSNIIRFKVNLSGDSVVNIRDITKMCIINWGITPISGLGVCYKDKPIEYYLDVELNEEEQEYLLKTYKYLQIVDMAKNLLLNSNHSVYEDYTNIQDQPINSPFCGGEYNLLYRDTYVQRVSRDELISYANS